MADREELAFGDKNIYPSDELIFSKIGDKKIIWQSIMNYASQNYKDITGEWRYYNDGKQWLFKLVHKKKTIFWLGVLNDTFRVTFYFGNKAEPVVLASDLPEKTKNDFKNAQNYGTLRAITTRISGPSDTDLICKLIDLKISIK